MTVSIAPLGGDHAPLPEAGMGALRTENGNLPLDEVDVRASIAGSLAGVEITQGFRNPYDTPLEATYIFPLPDRAAVTAMRMEAADRVVDGRLQERGQARAEYTAAIERGQRAAIAEEDRPDVFTMRVGNILPGERVRVRLGLSLPLPYEDGELTFRFPLVVAPRYIPGEPLDGPSAGAGVMPDTDATPDASRISPPVLLPGFPNPVRLTLRADIDPAGLPLSRIASSLHAVAEESGAEGRTTVRLQPGERLDRDFILRLAVADPAAVTTALSLSPDRRAGLDDGPAETGPGGTTGTTGGTFTLTVLPPSDSGTPRPRDLVLVLDRSGSMGGWKVVAARRSAARIIDTLTSADRFSVLSFDHEVAWPAELPHELVPATDRHRFRAIEHLAGLTARGGTEMYAPLETAARLLGDSADSADSADGSDSADGTGRDRVLVLVTDGQVGNEDQIVAGLADRLSGVRVHTVGIDRAVNAGFLGRLAAIGRGRCELVESEDRLDAVMERIHRRIATPVVTDLEIHADGIEPGTVTPHRAADVFTGAALRIAGRWRGPAVPDSMVLRGTTADGGRWERRIGGTVSDHPAGTAVWARAFVRELEDRYVVGRPPPTDYPLVGSAAAGSAAGPVAGLPAGRDRGEQQIIAAALRFGVLCRFTAFVAVDSRVVTDGEAPHRVTQPVEMPDGWESPGVPGVAPATSGFATFGASRPVSAVPAAAPRRVAGAPMARPAPAPAPRERTGQARPKSAARPRPPAAGPAPDPPAPPAPPAADSVRAESGPPVAPGGPPAAQAGGGGREGQAPSPDGFGRTQRKRVAPQPAAVDARRQQPAVVVDARRLLATELAELRAAVTGDAARPEALSEAQRCRLLADLGSRLHALVVYLTGEGIGDAQFGGLRTLGALAADLLRCDETDRPRGAALDRLWERTHRVLAEYAADGEATA